MRGKIVKAKINMFFVGVVVAFGIYAAIAYAGPTLREVDAFEVTCGSTATRIRPPSGYLSSTGLHAFNCHLSRESPDDSAECVCIGGADVDQDDDCYPIGGCARAQNVQISLDGDAYCLREDIADTVLVCLGGVGVP